MHHSLSHQHFPHLTPSHITPPCFMSHQHISHCLGVKHQVIYLTVYHNIPQLDCTTTSCRTTFHITPHLTSQNYASLTLHLNPHHTPFHTRSPRIAHHSCILYHIPHGITTSHHNITQFRLSASKLLLFVSVVVVLINAFSGIPNHDDLVS